MLGDLNPLVDGPCRSLAVFGRVWLWAGLIRKSLAVGAWCLLFVFIRQGLRGGFGPQRLMTQERWPAWYHATASWLTS